MKPLTKLNETALPDGTHLELWERDGTYLLLQDGQQIASSFTHGSDDTLAEIALAPIRRANQPAILVAGLGLGFALSALLKNLNREKASFVVAEPTHELVDWHRSYLKDLHETQLLDDERVIVEKLTPIAVARRSPKKFHAIVMKNIHGRVPMTSAEASDWASCLKEGGLMVISMARADHRLERILGRSGFQVSFDSVPASHKGKKTSFHTILIAKKGRFVSNHASRPKSQPKI